MLETLYSNYFEKSKSVFTHEDLIEAAISVGLDASRVKSVLDSDQYKEQVVRDQDLAHQIGATGVPFFVIDMKYGISGAQPQELFDKTLATASAEASN